MTKAFRFKLGRLLALRRVEERQAASASRAATERLCALDEACESLRGEREALFRALPEAVVATSEAPEGPRLILDQGRRLDGVLKRFCDEREVARRAATQAETEVARRRSARRALEELERIKKTEWAADLRRREAEEMDEIAGRRAAEKV
jgi:flagellar biosynthesis chaperone FliJ